MHTLVVGSHQTGRGPFIDRLLSALGPELKLYGYRSVKEPPGEDENCPIYIYPAAGERRRGQDNLLGWCKAQRATVNPEAFERYAYLIEGARPDGLLVLDEIGPMESASPRFCAAVLAALDGGIPVLASVRDKDTPFLERVRNHRNVRCFTLARDNAETLYPDVLDFLRLQIKGHFQSELRDRA